MPIKVGLQVIEDWNESLEEQVRCYEEENAPKGQIVFYGPSNFTRWASYWKVKPMRECLLGKSGNPCAINRGFGSSCSEHQLYYYPRMVRPLEPKVLVYYFAGNFDLFGYSVEESWELAQRVLIYTLTDFPECKIYLSGVNPKVNMDKDFMEKREWQNAQMKAFCEANPRCVFFDPFDCEELKNTEMFVADGVHFSKEGYDCYGAYLKEVLKEELEKY